MKGAVGESVECVPLQRPEKARGMDEYEATRSLQAPLPTPIFVSVVNVTSKIIYEIAKHDTCRGLHIQTKLGENNY